MRSALWLVLCGANDLPAFWAYEGLKRRGLQPLALVTEDQLGIGCRWVQRIDDQGVAAGLVTADGRTISTEETRGTFNRLMGVPRSFPLLAKAADRDYAIQEMTAFLMSWLAALPPPVLNAATPRGLSGAWRRAAEWTWLAASAGLPVASYFASTSDPANVLASEQPTAYPGAPRRTLFVVSGRAIGKAPSQILAGCRRLAWLAGTALLGMDFADTAAGPWTFCGASPWPDLRTGGDALLDALADTLGEGQEITP